jgi:hypothetical protein
MTPSTQNNAPQYTQQIDWATVAVIIWTTHPYDFSEIPTHPPSHLSTWMPPPPVPSTRPHLHLSLPHAPSLHSSPPHAPYLHSSPPHAPTSIYLGFLPHAPPQSVTFSLLSFPPQAWKVSSMYLGKLPSVGENSGARSSGAG